MPYTRTEWINNVTKLNATNMNHLEDGVSDIETAIISTNLDVYNVQQQANTNTSNISTLNTNVNTLSGQVSTNTNNIASVSGRVTALENTHTTYTDTNHDGNIVIAIVTSI